MSENVPVKQWNWSEKYEEIIADSMKNLGKSDIYQSIKARGILLQASSNTNGEFRYTYMLDKAVFTYDHSYSTFTLTEDYSNTNWHR